MSKAAKLPIVDPWPAEERPLDPARIAPGLWEDYVTARDAARGIPPAIFFVGPGHFSSTQTPDEKQRLTRRDQAKAALDARHRAYLKEDGRELYAQHGSPEAPLERVLASIDDLQFDYESRTAKAGKLTLYGLRERQGGHQASIKPTPASPRMPIEIGGRQSKRALRILLKRFAPSGLPPDDVGTEKVTQMIASDLESEAKEEAKAKRVEFDPKKVAPPKRDTVARVLRALGRE